MPARYGVWTPSIPTSCTKSAEEPDIPGWLQSERQAALRRNAQPAWRSVGGYQARWCIEPLFRILTSHGLRLEDSQMAAAERLKKLSAAALKAACITLQLVQGRDGAHAPPAACVCGDAAIDTIEAWTATLEGKTRRQQNPHPPRRLARARWLAARLGGWNCYAKPAGPLTMHRGPQRFHAIHQGRMLALMPK